MLSFPFECLWLRRVTWLTTYITSMMLLASFFLLGFSQSLSAPGGQLAFESNRDGNWEIYVMDIHRQIAFNLTRHPADDLGPAWSSQNEQIAFYSNRDGQPGTEIYVMNADGSGIIQVTPDRGNYWRPDWSADGRRLVFLLDYGNIQILDVNAGRIADFTYGFAPVWSPTDSRIAYYADRQGDLNGEVYLLEADGRNFRNLTRHAAHDWEPAWSPDGQNIAFVSSRDGNAEIYVMDAACESLAFCGDNIRRLTHNQATDRAPAWSPDGQQVAFESDSYGTTQIFLIHADGTKLRQLTNGIASNRSPVWLH